MVYSFYVYTRRTGSLPGTYAFWHETALLFHGPHETRHEAFLCRTRGEGPHLHPCKAVRTADETCLKTVGKWDTVHFVTLAES